MTIAQLGAGRLVGGRYVLVAPIGRGGMGEVWRARHVALASFVAIKFLHAASAGSESSRRRFLTEAQVTANLRSRHAVQVFDFGVAEDGLPYLVMELLEGETLDQRIARHGKLSVEVTARVLQKAARALARAHQLGIVHRDFKPENIMLVADEEEGSEGGESVKVVDFGVAKLLGALDETLGGALASVTLAEGRSPSSLSVTSTGLGTPLYMAPEQVSGASKIGPAADVWAFGVVAYECLTGRRPFGGDTVGDLLLKVLMATPPRPASADGSAPPAFDAWFAIACARDADKRFQDIGGAVTALLAALGLPGSDAPRATDPAPASKQSREIEAPRATRSRRGIAAALAAIVSVAAGAIALRDRPSRATEGPPVIAARVEIPAGDAADHDATHADAQPVSAATAPSTSAVAAPLPIDAAKPRLRAHPPRPTSPRLPPLGL